MSRIIFHITVLCLIPGMQFDIYIKINVKMRKSIIETRDNFVWFNIELSNFIIMWRFSTCRMKKDLIVLRLLYRLRIIYIQRTYLFTDLFGN